MEQASANEVISTVQGVTEKRNYLDFLWNKYGHFDTQVSKKLEDGTHQYWRRKPWVEARDNFSYIKQINHRSIFPTEVVIDLEEPELQKSVCEQLTKEGFSYYCYQTGSRGHHIHLQFPELVFYRKDFQKAFKQKLIERFCGDLAKAGTNCMIALELTPHWKTGNKKSMLLAKRSFSSNNHNPLKLPKIGGGTYEFFKRAMV